MSAGNYNEANEEFEKACEAQEIDAQNAVAWNGWGVALSHLGRYQEAIEKYRKALQIRPQYAEACRNMGLAFAAQKDYAQAIEYYRQATHINPDHITACNWGNSLFKQKRYAQAIEQYEKAIKLNAQNTQAWQFKIRALANLGRLDEAVSAGREAVRNLPNASEVLEELAKVYFQQHKDRQGLEILDQGLRADPQNKTLWKAKLDGLGQTTDSILAEQAVQQAMAVFPGDAEMVIAVARFWKGRGEYSKALESLERASRLNETTPDATLKEQTLTIWMEKGWLYVDWNYIDQAVEQFECALQRDPQHIPALRWKIKSLCRRRKLYDAAVMLDRLLAPDSPQAQEVVLLSERGSLRLQQTRYGEAVEAFADALKIDAANSDALVGTLLAYRLQRAFGTWEKFWKEKIIEPGIPEDSALLAERCRFFLDQRDSEAGFEYCRQRPDTDIDALQWRIFFLRYRRDFDTAEKEAEAALARFPKNVSLLNELALAHFDRRRHDKAAHCFQTIIDDHLTNEDAYWNKANSLRAQGPDQFQAAEKVIGEGLDQIPESGRLYTLLGRIHYESNDLQNSDKYLAQAIKLSPPDELEADFLRIEVLERLRRGDEARQAALDLKSRRSNDLEVRHQLGWFHLRRNDVLSAKKELDFILNVDPKHVAGVNGLGAIHFTQGNFAQGEDCFREAFEREPNDPGILTNLAWALVRREEEGKAPANAVARKWHNLKKLVLPKSKRQEEKDGYSEAEALCHQAIALEPRSAQSYICLGTIAFKRGRILESEDHLRASIRVSKDGGYVDLGAVYVHMGKYEDAEANLKKGVEVSRTDSRARIELGNLCLLTHREKEGIRLFREAADIDPTNPEPPRALALALQRQGELREAEEVLRQAIKKLDAHRRWQLHLTLAQLLTELGDKSEDSAFYDDALEEIKTAIPLKPSSAEIYFRAGIVWYRLENYKRAAKHFRACLNLDPNHIEAERNLRIVRSLIQQQVRRARSVFWLGFVLGSFCLLGTIAIWILYFYTKDMITANMIIGLTPTLIAFAAAAFLFPYLVHLKLPGIEAQLSQPTENISKGPVGKIS